MAYKKLSDAMSGKPPSAAETIRTATGDKTVATGKPAPKPTAPKSDVSLRSQYAEAMNAGNRELGAKLWAQIQAQEKARKSK